MVRETVLGQSAFDPNDAQSPVDKTYRLAALSRGAYLAGLQSLDRGALYEHLSLAPVRRALAAIRRSPAAELDARVADAQQAIDELGRVTAAV